MSDGIGVGDMVMVTWLCDQQEQPTTRFVGRVGRVTSVIENNDVGATPADPFYIVSVPVLGLDGFWGEELELLSARREET